MLTRTHQVKRHCTPVHGGATVHPGAEHTLVSVSSPHDSGASPCPKFKVLGWVSRIRKVRGVSNYTCSTTQSTRYSLNTVPSGFQSQLGAETMPTTPASLRAAHALSQAHHALARHIPDMGYGFTIGTAYGQVNIPPGPTAKRITALVEKMLRAELAQAAKEGGAA
jgi:hypothetical protein